MLARHRSWKNFVAAGTIGLAAGGCGDSGDRAPPHGLLLDKQNTSLDRIQENIDVVIKEAYESIKLGATAHATESVVPGFFDNLTLAKEYLTKGRLEEAALRIEFAKGGSPRTKDGPLPNFVNKLTDIHNSILGNMARLRSR